MALGVSSQMYSMEVWKVMRCDLEGMETSIKEDK